MTEIDRFYANELLFGFSPTAGLVAAELEQAGSVALYFRDLAEDGETDPPQAREQNREAGAVQAGAQEHEAGAVQAGAQEHEAGAVQAGAQEHEAGAVQAGAQKNEAGVGAIRCERQKLEPFAWIEDPKLLQGFGAPFQVDALAGSGKYRHLVRLETWSALKALKQHLKRVTRVNAGSPEAPFHILNDEISQYLLATGQTMFKKMKFSQLHRLQVDLETYCAPEFQFSNPERESDRIIVISMCDNFGWECCLSGVDMSEKEMLQEFVRIFHERDPDVVEGHNLFKFDLPYLTARARLHGISLTLGRDGSIMTAHSSRFNAGERNLSYHKASIRGRHVIDTMFLALLYDVTFRNLKTFGLKDIARHFGVASENRTYVPGDQISRIFREDPERLLDYAMDDVRETRAIAEILGQSYFVQTQIFPLSFQNAAIRGNATKINLLFLREYYRRKRALPARPTGRRFAGAFTDMKVQGVVRDVLHCDIRSLYPSIMLSFNYVPASDSLGVFSGILADLRSFRLEAKATARNAERPSDRNHAQALQATFKVLINSFYGYLAFEQGHFADFERAAQVTSKGRELLKHMVSWLEQRGARVIEIDTDGIYFVAPDDVQGAEAEEALIKTLNETLPEGIDAELDGRYPGMFSYKIKNYVLLEEDGLLLIKGSGLRSRAVEQFQRSFMERIFFHLLNDSISELAQEYRKLVEDIKNHRWEPSQFWKRDILQDSLELYQKKVAEGSRKKAAAYELALHSERNFQQGDHIMHYVTGRSKKVKVFEVAKLASSWDPNHPDENTAYYLAKLDELYKKFEPFIVEAGGLSLAALQSGQLELVSR